MGKRPPRNFNVDVALPERINAVQAMRLNEILLTKITVFELGNLFSRSTPCTFMYYNYNSCIIIIRSSHTCVIVQLTLSLGARPFSQRGEGEERKRSRDSCSTSCALGMSIGRRL